MTPADLARYLARHQVDAQLITDIGDTATVPKAAAALGVSVEQILKTLLFYIQGKPYVVISHGVEPVAVRALADFFGVGKRQIKLARPQQVLVETGYPVGGVPPLGHINAHPVVMAETILDYKVAFGGGGDDKTMLRIAVAELLRLHLPILLALK
jgi:prolyl-tRNA editing enzyme YbaK/EbsC (Cys-tRNA(Pro) deacylase)